MTHPPRLLQWLRRLAIDERGLALIEMALVTPILATLAVGAFEASRMVTRQQELQSAALEGQEIALAANAGAETDVQTLQSILMNSLDLPAEDVSVVKVFRCDASTGYVDTPDACSEGAIVSSYVRITLTDTYTPVWADFGVGGSLDYNVERMVQLS